MEEHTPPPYLHGPIERRYANETPDGWPGVGRITPGQGILCPSFQLGGGEQPRGRPAGVAGLDREAQRLQAAWSEGELGAKAQRGARRGSKQRRAAAAAAEAGDCLAGETGPPVCGKANGEEPSRTSRRREEEAAAAERGRTPDPRDLFPSFSAGTCSCNMTLEDLAGDHQAFGRYGISSMRPLAVRGTASPLQRRSVARWKLGVGGGGGGKQRGSRSRDHLAGVAPPAGRQP